MVPLSYVYGYRGGIGRRGVGQDTTGDDGIEIRAQIRRYQLIPWRCAANFVPKSAIWTTGRCGSTEKRPIWRNFLSTARCAWAVLGGIPSGWGQFGAVKKWAGVIASRGVQLPGTRVNALYTIYPDDEPWLPRLGAGREGRGGAGLGRTWPPAFSLLKMSGTNTP